MNNKPGVEKMISFVAKIPLGEARMLFENASFKKRMTSMCKKKGILQQQTNPNSLGILAFARDPKGHGTISRRNKLEFLCPAQAVNYSESLLNFYCSIVACMQN